MDMELKKQFLTRWEKYFPGAELPLAFFYTNIKPEGLVEPPPHWRCMICDLARARKGAPLAFHKESFGCSGGCRYSGFTTELRDNFRYFLSTGIPGEMEGERYKKSPELVDEVMALQTMTPAPSEYIVFKHWDQVELKEEPIAVIFFAPPDVLSGLFTLANFAQSDPNGVFVPFSAGCASIIEYPRKENESDNPRAVLGMMDVSARPCVSEGLLTFSVPMKKFVSMVGDMDESFLTTNAWVRVRKRIEKNSRG